jgi:hypothetical protein
MKQKYIEETFKNYFIFGERSAGVDLNDGTRDVATSITKAEAQELIKDRDYALNFLHYINEQYPEQFDKCFSSYVYCEKESKDHA